MTTEQKHTPAIVVSPPAGLTSNGIALDLFTGMVYVLHADGVNWTSGAKLTELTHEMARRYPAPTMTMPADFRPRFIEAVRLREQSDLAYYGAKAQRDEVLEALRETTEELCAAGPNGISQLIARNRQFLAKYGA